MRDRQAVERVGGRWAWDTVCRVPAATAGEPMSASDNARTIMAILQKKNDRYYGPELDDLDLPDVPPTIKVWDADMAIIRYMAFAEDEAGAESALQYARDTIATFDTPAYYWPEAWWKSSDGKWKQIEGWGRRRIARLTVTANSIANDKE